MGFFGCFLVCFLFFAEALEAQKTQNKHKTHGRLLVAAVLPSVTTHECSAAPRGLVRRARMLGKDVSVGNARSRGRERPESRCCSTH